MDCIRVTLDGCLQAWAVSWRRPCCARIPRRCRCGTPMRPRLPPHLLRDRRQRLPQPACWRGCRCRLAARSAPRRPPRCSAGCLRAGGNRPQRADQPAGGAAGDMWCSVGFLACCCPRHRCKLAPVFLFSSFSMQGNVCVALVLSGGSVVSGHLKLGMLLVISTWHDLSLQP